MNEDFYIGWEDKTPARHRRATRRIVGAALLLGLLAAMGLAASQRLIGVAYFEWGNVKEFTGILHVDPYPHLVLSPGQTNATTTLVAPLVAPFKFGLKREKICGLDSRRVTLQATRIHRDGQLMLEADPQSIMPADSDTAPTVIDRSESPVVSLGRHTFQGEIVDSKCWMGVMNPGVLTPHRACAVRCISGGIPPMLLVRREGAPPLNLLLVSTDDKPVNDLVLDLVAEPVEVTGEVVRHGQLLTLRANPKSYRAR